MNNVKLLNEKIIDMLNRYVYTKAEIVTIALELEEIENNYNLYSSIMYSDNVSCSNNIESTIEKELLNRENRLPKLKALRRAKEIEVEKIEISLNSFSERDKDIIKYRYFKKLKWNDVAQIIGLTDIRCRQLNKEIINKIRKSIFIEV
ncbi:MAG: sigma factor-like helix-turn-helix DNA-binding protein [Peptostreptococcaceae bacterium]